MSNVRNSSKAPAEVCVPYLKLSPSLPNHQFVEYHLLRSLFKAPWVGFGKDVHSEKVFFSLHKSGFLG